MKRVALTGGAGFIGSHLAERLVAEGLEVRILDDLSTGSRENLTSIESSIDFHEGDLTDPATLEAVFAGCDTVFHLGAMPSVPRSIEDPLNSHRINATGTLTVLDVARRVGVRRVVYSASSSAYGESPELPKHEGLPDAPKSPYGVAKLTGELYGRVYAEVFGLETVSLRYFNIFGSRQAPGSPYAAVIPCFLSRMLEGQRPIINGDGEHSRDFTHVSNAVEANVRAARAEGVKGDVVNVACGKRATLNELVGLLNELLGTDLSPEYADPRSGDILHSMAAIDRARDLLGFRPTIELREGLVETIAWFRETFAARA